MSKDQLAANVTAMVQTLWRLKPATAKGVYFKSIAVSATMGPSVRLDPLELARLLEA